VPANATRKDPAGAAGSGAHRPVVRRGFVRASAIVAMATIAVKSITLVREAVVAGRFGVGDEMDAFVAAFIPISIGANLIASIGAALVPAYVRRFAAQSAADANALVEELLLPIGLVLVLVTGLAALAAPAVLDVFALGYPAGKRAAAVALFRAMLPVLPLAGLGGILTGVLNARERYFIVAFAPAAIPIAVLATVALTGGLHGLMPVAVATSAGFLLQAFALGTGMRREGVRLVPRWQRLSDDARGVLREVVPLMAGNFVLSGTMVVDQVMTSTLPVGSVSTLSYGGRLTAQLTGLATVTVGTVLLPRISRTVAEGREGALLGNMKRAAGLAAAAGIPGTLLLVLLSPLLVDLMYHRGQVTAADAVLIAQVQSLLFLQLPFVVLAAVFVRVLMAVNRSSRLLVGAVISVALNAALDWVLMRRYGVSGIALSTTLVAAASCLFLGVNAFAEVRRRARAAAA